MTARSIVRLGAMLPLLSLDLACTEPAAQPLAETVFMHELRATGPLVFDSAVVSQEDAQRARLSVYVRNELTEPLEIETGVCPFRLRAYPSPTLHEPATWTDARREPWGCPDVGVGKNIPPGGTNTVDHWIEVTGLVAWPPPPDTHLAIALLLNDSLRVVPATRRGFRR